MSERARECGHPGDDESGRVCRRLCAEGRDYHGGGHWYAAPDLDGDLVRRSTAQWIVTGQAYGPTPCATCGHASGDHQSGGTRFPHPPVRGLCLAPGCDCRRFVDTQPEEQAA